MKQTPILSVLGTLIVAGILVCVAYLWTHQLTAERGNVVDGSHTEPRVALVASTPAEDTSKLGKPDRNSKKQPLEREDDLFQLCPGPVSDLSPDCWRKLDQLLWDKPLGIYSGILLSPTSLTYRQIYADPANDRNLVLQAMQREECRLGNGDFGLTSRVYCNAESFAKFGSFLAACEITEERDYTYEWLESKWSHKGKSRFRLELDHLEQYRTVDPDELDRARNENEIWLYLLESHWRAKQCLDYDMSVLGMGPDSEERKQLSLISKQWVEEQSLDPATTLVLIAAKLGEGWSLPQYVLENHLVESSQEVYADYLERHDPWIRTLSEARIPFHIRSKQMHAAIHAVVALQDKGWEIALERLVARLCEKEQITRIYEHGVVWRQPASSCREAIGQLSASIPQSNFRELKVLDEFERIALELGVYDPPQREPGWE